MGDEKMHMFLDISGGFFWVIHKNREFLRLPLKEFEEKDNDTTHIKIQIPTDMVKHTKDAEAMFKELEEAGLIDKKE